MLCIQADCESAKVLKSSSYTMMQGEGDTVTATALDGRPGEVVIESIEGDHGRLSLVAADNCVGIAVVETMKLLGQASCGVSLKLNKVEGAFSYCH